MRDVETTRMEDEPRLRDYLWEIITDARIWLVPVILAICFAPDIRIFIAMPIVIGVISIILASRKSGQ